MSIIAPTQNNPASTAQASLKTTPPVTPQRGKRGSLFQRGKLALVLWALMAPTIIGMVLFIFYPQFSAVKFSLYDWDGDTKQELVWFKNFREAFTQDRVFWQCFGLVGILLVANLIKMWPSILTAVALHRIKSERAQYIYRVLFVIPMIIPGLVMLLMWKSFYDPQIGILNVALNKTGLMSVLAWLDGTKENPGFMPWLANAWGTRLIRDDIISNIFGGVWGMILFAAMLLSVRPGLAAIRKGTFWWVMLTSIGFGYFYGSIVADDHPWFNLGPIPIDLYALVVGSGRLILSLAIVFAISGWAGDPRREILLTIAKSVGGVLLALGAVLVIFTMVWTEPLPGAPFQAPAPDIGAQPSWLGNSSLIIPAIIFWGFPWIGTVGVLIYLAGLESITTDVYEAAELDGVGSIRRLFSIELPLIMTQVRINLIFMTIGTLSDFGLLLLLLGPDGGPGKKGMVPGLYAYKAAFIDGRFGYACALGMVMFFIILFITIVYQKYVRVEK